VHPIDAIFPLRRPRQPATVPFHLIFSVRQHIAYMLSVLLCYRPSISLSVRPSVHHTGESYKNSLSYDDEIFTAQ